MTALGFVALAAAGAVTRWSLARFNADFPSGTLIVNIVGAFLAGLLAGLGQDGLTVVVVGGLGSFTTFSTLMVEVVDRSRAPAVRALYLTITLVVGVGAAWLGLIVSDA